MDWKQFIKDRQATLASGLIAFLIIFVGFMAFNYFSKTESPTQTVETEETQSEVSNKEMPEAKPAPTTDGKVSPKAENVALPATYQVAKGDHLWSIAEKYYGDGFKWTEIAKANNIKTPSKIHTGNKLSIPKLEVTATAKAGEAVKASAGNVKYTVKTGDTLWSIADQHYKSGFEWSKIQTANKDKIGLLPNGRPLIKPGDVLLVP